MNEQKEQLTVWWVIWAALQSGIFVIYHFLGSTGAPVQHSVAVVAEPPVWLAGVAPVAFSAVVRWLVLPRAQSAQAALPLFVVGMAMAEATCMLGLFVFPAHKQELFILSACGIFQFIPLFARRYFADEANRND